MKGKLIGMTTAVKLSAAPELIAFGVSLAIGLIAGGYPRLPRCPHATDRSAAF